MTLSLWNHIRSLYPPGSTIIEFGSGSISTPRLAEHYNVISFEHNAQWANNVSSMLPQKNPTGYHSVARVIHAPLNDLFYDIDVIRQHLPEKYDLIIIDGPPYSPVSSRARFVDLWVDGLLFDPLADIVVDDVHRASDMDIANRLAELTNKKLTIIKEPAGNQRHDSAILS